MFNNLIESSSHVQEFKRRGSFLLFTTATYLVLFVITGVASIYAYDAHLESQSTEWEVTFMPVPLNEPPPQERNTIRPAANSNTPTTARSVRTELYASVSNPNITPVNVSTAPHNIPDARPDSVRDTFNADPITPAGRTGVPDGTGNKPLVEMVEPPPPPPPAPTPVVPKVLNVSKGVLSGKAISLPKPSYPSIARPIRLHGAVSVQVLIDEDGKVISAKAVSGHPIFVPEALKAAMQARFSPTMLSQQPVKVSGVITYHFVLQ